MAVFFFFVWELFIVPTRAPHLRLNGEHLLVWYIEAAWNEERDVWLYIFTHLFYLPQVWRWNFMNYMLQKYFSERSLSEAILVVVCVTSALSDKVIAFLLWCSARLQRNPLQWFCCGNRMRPALLCTLATLWGQWPRQPCYAQPPLTVESCYGGPIVRHQDNHVFNEHSFWGSLHIQPCSPESMCLVTIGKPSLLALLPSMVLYTHQWDSSRVLKEWFVQILGLKNCGSVHCFREFFVWGGK